MSGITLSPFYGGGLTTWKKFLWVKVIYESKSSGNLTVAYMVDDGTYTNVVMDMTVGSAGDRTHQTININENGRELTIKFIATSVTWKVHGIVFGYQDQPINISR